MKRKTRVQVAVVRDGMLLVLYHEMPADQKRFWGLPGGGVEENETPEQAAIREVREETGLDIILGDFRFEYDPENRRYYDRVITFVGYPTGGEARLGCDPEEGMTDIVRLTDIKWHPLAKDEGLEGMTDGVLGEIRRFFKMS